MWLSAARCGRRGGDFELHRQPTFAICDFAGNTERVYLDVIAQSQSNDEFWYTCVPNDVASELESCGNTGFRETEISIDGRRRHGTGVSVDLHGRN